MKELISTILFQPFLPVVYCSLSTFRYARKYLNSTNPYVHSDPDIHKPMALLAFKPDSRCPRYEVRANSFSAMSYEVLKEPLQLKS